MHLDVVGRVQDFVGLHVHRHVATSGAPLAAGYRGASLGGSIRIGPVKFPGSPFEGSHQLMGCSHATQPGRQLGDGALEEIVAVVGGVAGGHESGELARDCRQ